MVMARPPGTEGVQTCWLFIARLTFLEDGGHAVIILMTRLGGCGMRLRRGKKGDGNQQSYIILLYFSIAEKGNKRKSYQVAGHLQPAEQDRPHGIAAKGWHIPLRAIEEEPRESTRLKTGVMAAPGVVMSACHTAW